MLKLAEADWARVLVQGPKLPKPRDLCCLIHELEVVGEEGTTNFPKDKQWPQFGAATLADQLVVLDLFGHASATQLEPP